MDGVRGYSISGVTGDRVASLRYSYTRGETASGFSWSIVDVDVDIELSWEKAVKSCTVSTHRAGKVRLGLGNANMCSFGLLSRWN